MKNRSNVLVSLLAVMPFLFGCDEDQYTVPTELYMIHAVPGAPTMRVRFDSIFREGSILVRYAAKPTYYGSLASFPSYIRVFDSATGAPLADTLFDAPGGGTWDILIAGVDDNIRVAFRPHRDVPSQYVDLEPRQYLLEFVNLVPDLPQVYVAVDRVEPDSARLHSEQVAFPNQFRERVPFTDGVARISLYRNSRMTADSLVASGEFRFPASGGFERRIYATGLAGNSSVVLALIL